MWFHGGSVWCVCVCGVCVVLCVCVIVCGYVVCVWYVWCVSGVCGMCGVCGVCIGPCLVLTCPGSQPIAPLRFSKALERRRLRQ